MYRPDMWKDPATQRIRISSKLSKYAQEEKMVSQDFGLLFGELVKLSSEAKYSRLRTPHLAGALWS